MGGDGDRSADHVTALVGADRDRGRGRGSRWRSTRPAPEVRPPGAARCRSRRRGRRRRTAGSRWVSWCAGRGRCSCRPEPRQRALEPARRQQPRAGQAGRPEQHGAAAERHGRRRHPLNLTWPPVEPGHHPPSPADQLSLLVDGVAVQVADRGVSLLDVLRDDLGIRSVKDGCSPQGQCGCCTVLVDGTPRVACVTPARRMVGREVTTLDGLAPEVRDRWADALDGDGREPVRLLHAGDHRAARGAPIASARRRGRHRRGGRQRCGPTSAGARAGGPSSMRMPSPRPGARARRPSTRRGPGGRRPPRRHRGRLSPGGRPRRRRSAAAGSPPTPHRPTPSSPSPTAAAAGSSATRWPTRCGWPARCRVGAPRWPPSRRSSCPDGEWDLTLRTSWVEPAYLEPDASWCEPGGEPWSPVANGGAFGGKADLAGARRGPRSWPTSIGAPCSWCSRARTWCGWDRSVRRSRPVCAPTAPA